MIASDKQTNKGEDIDGVSHRINNVSDYMKNSFTSKIYLGFIILFSICWIGFITLDYFQKHPNYGIDIKAFRFYGTLCFNFFICGAITFGYSKFPEKFSGLSKGISIYLFVLAMISITFYSANSAAANLIKATDLSLSGILHMQGMFIKVSFFLFSILLSCYAAGNLFCRTLKISFQKKSKDIIQTGLGIMLVVMIAFFIGAVKGLYWFVLGPVLLLIIGLNWKESLAFSKKMIWDKIKVSKQLNPLGVFCFLFLSYLIGMNLLQNLTPWPKGWDSLSLYVNLPQLINEYHALVKGFQPYNWSLFMSFGLVLFNSIETTLSLAFMGGVLCLFAMYPIARNTLKLDANYSLLAMLTFYLIPTVGFQSFLEQKVDLGLLFVILIIVNIILTWSKHKQKERKVAADNTTTEAGLPIKKASLTYLVLAGLLTGFAFGIKLTTLFSFFGIVGIIWFLNLGSLAFLGISLLAIFGILLVKLDDMSGMRQYHLTADIVQWFLLVAGIAIIGFVSLKNRKGLFDSIKQTVIYGAFFVLTTLPWLGKNYIDAGQKLSFNYLMNGKSNSPIFNSNAFDINHQKTLKNDE